MYLKSVGEVSQTQSIENPTGVFRKTLTYNDQIMICHFTLTRGAQIPLHNHAEVQAGYVIKGLLKFLKSDGEEFMAGPGTSYSFESNEYHGADVLEDSEVIDCFTPVRPEYIP